MFKVPEWGNDVPSINTNVESFTKKNKKIKERRRRTPERAGSNIAKKSNKSIVKNTSLKNNKNSESKLNNCKIKAESNKISLKIKTKQNNAQENKEKNKRKQIKTMPSVLRKSNKNDSKFEGSKKSRHNHSESKHEGSLNNNNANETKPTKSESKDIPNYDVDNINEIIRNAQKKKLVDKFTKENNKEVLFDETGSKYNKKQIGNVLNSSTSPKLNKKPFKTLHSNEDIFNMKKSVKKNHEDNNLRTDKSTKVKRKLCEDQKNKNIFIKKRKMSVNEEYESEKTKSELNSINTLNSVDKVSVQCKKKRKLKNLLEMKDGKNANRSLIKDNSGNELRKRMLQRLNAAKFRYLNEQLYTSSGSDAQKLFGSDPNMFQTYHQGYQQQVKKWPVNPLELVVKRIKNMPKTHLIADLGCGEAALSQRIPHTVRSFDLVATKPNVEVCNMAHTPLLTGSMNVAVYCLALMGTDLTQYLLEANRILKLGGHLLIAEVESRFDDVESFVKAVQQLGFTLKKLDKSHQVFFFMEFLKAREAPVKKSKLPTLTLKPCIYKKR